ncbi:PLDc N-terminal domain-containing protein [Leifsonia sp. TF02-11]|uniref:PLDc N-terminal domain-containing protein n=1 Tax=Leifsonia sp. TF02-11 TaxID=2815212 RepID=UPI001AA0C62F|nr:PLDc N-terminal domain-containing protein [Leifsonia sp. TF02-11]MBO1741603.1 PLDc N-terminal domain-containing protein [Leifsonia sp. TF02-11]
MNTPDVLGWVLVIVGFVALAAWLTFIVIAAVQIVRSSQMEYWSKVLWIVALVLFPLLGVLCWYAFGDRTRHVENTITTHLR